MITISDGTAVVATCLVALGWYVTAKFNQKQDIEKEQFKYRLETLQSLFPIISSLNASNKPFIDD